MRQTIYTLKRFFDRKTPLGCLDLHPKLRARFTKLLPASIISFSLAPADSAGK